MPAATIVKTRMVKPLPYVILSEVETEPLHWLWYPYIPRGGLSMIVGDGGYGKSWMTCAITADLSQGRALPGQDPLPPQKVLMISAEDGVSQIIKPKMEKLNANMANIAVFDEGFALNPAMADSIASAMKEFDATVVFLDPMVAYIGGHTDMFRANETRDILSQLDRIAKETNTAIVGVHHVRKAMASVAQHKTMGSVDFVNGVRSTLLVDISKAGQYYMAHVKANWSKKGPPLAYSMDNDVFRWEGEYTSLEEPHEISKTPRNKAKAFLMAMLRNGPVPATEMVKLGIQEGINERTLSRSKKGIARSFQKDDRWFWELEPGVEPHPETIGTGPDKLIANMAGTSAVTIVRPEPTKVETEMEKVLREARERLGSGGK